MREEQNKDSPPAAEAATQSAPATGDGDAAEQPVNFMVAFDDPEMMDVILGSGAPAESYRIHPSDSERE